MVVDGAWRDLKEITEHRFPVFARAWTPSGPHKDLGGSVNVPISCGGVVVKPCDVIVGDDDGLVVIPFESLTDILVKAAEIHEKEKAIMADTRKEIIEAPSPYTTDERLRKMGIKIV